MKILTDEMPDVINDAMDAYAEADDKNVLRYANRLFATLDTVLSIAEVRDDINGAIGTDN